MGQPKMGLPEACRRLGMSREGVILRIGRKEFKGGQILGRWYVMEESVDRYLADMKEVEEV